LIKTQKEQLEHITNLENIIKDLTTKLSEQETQIKTINDDNEENKKVSYLLLNKQIK
jgi:RNA binding exosome subunit